MHSILSKQALLTTVSYPEELSTSQKISIIGTGKAGMACAMTLLLQNVANELTLIDTNIDIVTGEMLDLEYSSIFLNSPKLMANTDIKEVRGSRIIIIATQGEILTDLTIYFNKIIPEIASICPDAIIIVASEPVDILSFLIWKLSGFPPYRVIGTGTALDSARFRYLISKRLDVAPTVTHAFIIGQRGETSVPVWSGVSVSGVRLREINPLIGYENDVEKWNDLHREVLDSEQCVVELKGCTCWGIGLTVTKLIDAILRNTRECYTVSTFVKGCRHGVDRDVYLSLPCIIGKHGIVHIVKQQLTEYERDKLQTSANSLYDLQKKNGI